MRNTKPIVSFVVQLNESSKTRIPYSVFGSSDAPYKIYNIGNNQPVELMYFIETLEKCLDKTAIKNMMPIQPVMFRQALRT